MSALLIVSLIAGYFGLLLFVSYLTSRGADNDSFFTGNKKSPWYLVAFGMIGTSLSGVTFLSVPGWAGNPDKQFSYMQVVLGYFIGYIVVAYVLMPIYYRMNLTSIYSYLGERFGFYANKTGAIFFLGSRLLGASIRLLLVANVLQELLFDQLNVPFELTVFISIALIWVYTNKGGIKTIIWTDALQTFFMIAAVLLAGYIIIGQLDMKDGVINTIADSQYSKIFFMDDWLAGNYFWKHFLGGIFIAIGMTGLDQDMMQKNLSCKNIGEAKKNMMSFAVVLVFVNLIFLGLGALLFMYSAQTGIGEGVSGDQLFAKIAIDPKTGLAVGILFLLGLIAAAYSSADSALTALTTSFSHDIFGIKKKTPENQIKLRKQVHIFVSVLLLIIIIILKHKTDRSAIDLILTFAAFTYGPLIGLFFFGILTKRVVKDKLIPIMCLLGLAVTVFLWYFSQGGQGAETLKVFGNYKIGSELIVINAMITYAALYAVSNKKVEVLN